MYSLYATSIESLSCTANVSQCLLYIYTCTIASFLGLWLQIQQLRYLGAHQFYIVFSSIQRYHWHVCLVRFEPFLCPNVSSFINFVFKHKNVVKIWFFNPGKNSTIIDISRRCTCIVLCIFFKKGSSSFFKYWSDNSINS